MFGKYVSKFGAPCLLQHFPLEFNSNGILSFMLISMDFHLGELNFSWLLPIYSKYNNKVEMEYFQTNIIPIIKKVEEYSTSLSTQVVLLKLINFSANQ